MEKLEKKELDLFGKDKLQYIKIFRIVLFYKIFYNFDKYTNIYYNKNTTKKSEKVYTKCTQIINI